MTTTTAFSPAESGLDLVQNNSTVKDCPNGKVPYLLGTNPTQRRAVIFRPRCKMWACPACGPANAWVWSFRASDGAHSLYDNGATLAFVTITPHEKLTAGQSWWVMPRAWMKLQARVRRAAGKFEYFCVPELHKTGKVHLHMIVTADLSKRWWRTNGRECGFGYQNDVQEVWSEGGVIGYINKYLVKGLAVKDMPPRTRRVRTSRGWPKSPKPDPPEGWSFQVIPRRQDLLSLANYVEDQGYVVHLLGSRSAWSVVNPPE